jgi:CRISPR/Cas system CSM-associated protein Csm2 small subunit
MTIEELFTEEYKKLKEENKKLVYQNNMLQDVLTKTTNRRTELEQLIRSLKPVIDKNAYNDTKYIYFSNNYIPEISNYYQVALWYAKDVKKEEDKDNAKE